MMNFMKLHLLKSSRKYWAKERRLVGVELKKKLQNKNTSIDLVGDILFSRIVSHNYDNNVLRHTLSNYDFSWG